MLIVFSPAAMPKATVVMYHQRCRSIPVTMAVRRYGDFLPWKHTPMCTLGLKFLFTNQQSFYFIINTKMLTALIIIGAITF